VKIIIKELALGFVAFFGILRSLQIASSLIPFLSFKGNKCSNGSAQCFKIALYGLVDLLLYFRNFIMLGLCDELTSSLKLFHDLAVIESKTDISNLEVLI
jgi:hypothetical protein